MSSNETPLGASPHAIEAYKAAATKLELYPDGSATQLRDTIGARYGLDPNRIVCGAGSDELLSLITNAYIGPGDEGIYTEHGFLVYKIAIQAAGGGTVYLPKGEYKTTATLDVPPYVSIEGEGQFSILRVYGCDGLNILPSNVIGPRRVSNFWLYGNGTDAFSGIKCDVD